MHAPHIKSTQTPSAEQKKTVLTKALMRATEQLELTRAELSLIIGASEASLSRLFGKSKFVEPTTSEGQLALLLLRFYRSLNTLFGGNTKQCRQWLRSHNKHLDGLPVERIQSIEGLVNAVHYLDAMRGKN